MTWTFLYLMLFLKLPIIALLWLVWWAIKQDVDEPVAKDDDGGSRKPRHHPRPPLPRPPRRGPHGTPAPPPPARVRTVLARGRRVEH
jgi:hypothetical protein